VIEAFLASSSFISDGVVSVGDGFSVEDGEEVEGVEVSEVDGSCEGLIVL
jgi:hypothetical protein